MFDPGYDNIIGDIPGKGAIACRFAAYFFELLKKNNIPTHYVATVGDNIMIVEPAVPLSMAAESPEYEACRTSNGHGATTRRGASGEGIRSCGREKTSIASSRPGPREPRTPSSPTKRSKPRAS